MIRRISKALSLRTYINAVAFCWLFHLLLSTPVSNCRLYVVPYCYPSNIEGLMTPLTVNIIDISDFISIALVISLFWFLIIFLILRKVYSFWRVFYWFPEVVHWFPSSFWLIMKCSWNCPIKFITLSVSAFEHSANKFIIFSWLIFFQVCISLHRLLFRLLRFSSISKSGFSIYIISRNLF